MSDKPESELRQNLKQMRVAHFTEAFKSLWPFWIFYAVVAVICILDRVYLEPRP